jgi:hypothetical protein
MISIFFLGLALMTVGAKGIYEILKERAEYIKTSESQLLIGYELKINSSQLLIGRAESEGLFKRPIVVDMRITPHMFVCGLSNSGKSCMIEYAIRDKKVILVNVFKDDFKSIKARRINGNDKILEFFHEILKDIYYREKPLYIVMDELLILCMDSKITKAIMDLLAVGRHYNIYLIGISQIGTKETVKFKDLFNVRICFKQVEESSYRAVLGYSPEVKDLKPRQFLFYSDEIGIGRTYDVS